MRVATLTEEQQTFRDVTRHLLESESSPTKVRALTEARQPYDPKLWAVGGELGWYGLEAAEKFGGSGQSFYEASLVLHELGRTTTPGPYLSQMLAVAALCAVPDHPVADAWLERLVAGEAIGAVVLGTVDPTGQLDIPIKATTSGEVTTLIGTQSNLLDVGLADLVVIAAESEDGPVLIALDEPHDALSAAQRPTHDRTRQLYDIALEGAEVPGTRVLASGNHAQAVINGLWYRAAAGLALDSAGGAAKVVEMTVDYTTNRVQYGRVIATFQAVKHTVSDMFVESEVARVASETAAREIVAGSDAMRYWASVAKARACDAYSKAAGDALQMHGGIGMTWEFDLHFWLKRAKLNQALCGQSDAHRARVTRLV